MQFVADSDCNGCGELAAVHRQAVPAGRVALPDVGISDGRARVVSARLRRRGRVLKQSRLPPLIVVIGTKKMDDFSAENSFELTVADTTAQSGCAHRRRRARGGAGIQGQEHPARLPIELDGLLRRGARAKASPACRPSPETVSAYLVATDEGRPQGFQPRRRRGGDPAHPQSRRTGNADRARGRFPWS